MQGISNNSFCIWEAKSTLSEVVKAGAGGGNWASVGYIGKERFNYSFNDCNGLGISA